MVLPQAMAFLPPGGAGAFKFNLLFEDMAGSVHRSDALCDLHTPGSLRPLVQVAVPGRYQYKGGRTRKYLLDYLAPLPLPIDFFLVATKATTCTGSLLWRLLTQLELV